jgi:hypothetical protein
VEVFFYRLLVFGGKFAENVLRCSGGEPDRQLAQGGGRGRIGLGSGQRFDLDFFQ